MDKVSRRTRFVRIACLCCAVFGAAIPYSAISQTLNEAVNAQLEADLNFTPCALLLSGGPVSDLGTDGLFTICTRPVGQSGDPSSSSGGGFAATPPAPPSVVEERLKEEEDEESDQTRRGFFFSIGHDSVNRIASTFEDGYKSDTLRLAAGFDFAVGNSWVLGFAADGSEQEGDFLDGGDFEIRTLGLAGFGSYLIGDSGSFDFYVGYSQLSNDRQRRATFTEIEDASVTFGVEGAPIADFDATQVLAGLQFSHDWIRDNVTLGPRLGYNWTKTDYDTYSEVDSSGLALTFYDDEETSTQFYGGLAGSVAISTGFGAVMIDQSILYRYETDQDQRDVEVSFVEDTRDRRFNYQTEVPDRDFIEYSVGATFIRGNGVQIMLEYRGISSHAYLDTSNIGLSFRKEF